MRMPWECQICWAVHLQLPLTRAATSYGPELPRAAQVNSETDFVARNDQFRSLVSSAAAAALGVTALRPGGGAELDDGALRAAPLADGT